MFEVLNETSRSHVMNRIGTLLMSLIAHTVAIIFLIIVPLVFFSALPEGELLTFLIASPKPPPPPPPPAPPEEPKAIPAVRVTVETTDFVPPPSIPKGIAPPFDEPRPVGVIEDVSLAGIFSGSFDTPQGIPAGILGGTPPPAPAPPPPPRPRKVEPFRPGGKVQESKLIVRVEPVYPELAKRARVSGVVILEVNVDEEGNVSGIRVLRGHPLLDDAAVAAVKQWKYSPTLLNGEPVPVIATVTVVFNLR